MIAIDMKMPKNCAECRLSDYGHSECYGIIPGSQYIDIAFGQRPSGCPLIEVTHITDSTYVDHRLVEDTSPGDLMEGVNEIHASRMGKFIFDHQELIKTEHVDDESNGSRNYRTDCYVVNINQEAANDLQALRSTD